MRVLCDVEIPSLLAVIRPGEPFGARDVAMLKLLQHTGLRASELCGLRVGEVFQAGVPRTLVDLRRELGKGARARLVPLNATARAAVLSIVCFNECRGFSVASEAPLLVNRKGEALSVRTLQHLIQTYRERAGLSSRVTPHAFRHKFASDLARVTGNLRVVQSVLGHKRLETVQVYVQPSPEEIVQAVNQLS